MNKETGGPAFPTGALDSEGVPQHTEGMTLRDYFAAKAMQSLLIDPNLVNKLMTSVDISKLSYAMADAMLKARKQ